MPRAGPLRPSEGNDWLLSAELSLLGPILNIEQRLANRTRDYPVAVDRDAFRRRLDPPRATQLETSPLRLYRELWALAVTADLIDAQLRRCKQALRRFWLKEVARIAPHVRRSYGIGQRSDVRSRRPEVQPHARSVGNASSSVGRAGTRLAARIIRGDFFTRVPAACNALRQATSAAGASRRP